jgi:hypothetical protein
MHENLERADQTMHFTSISISVMEILAKQDGSKTDKSPSVYQRVSCHKKKHTKHVSIFLKS